MALRNILLEHDSGLQKKSRQVTDFNKRIHTLLDDMRDTLELAEGLGLAAVQIGVLRRAAVINLDGDLAEIINPEIISAEGEQTASEGCLSVPGKSGVTARPAKLKVKAQNRNGNWCVYSCEDLKARCFAHEMDHMDGVLFSERLAPGEVMHDNE